MHYKICSKCSREIPATIEYFSKSNTCKGGLNTSCRNCQNEYSQKWRKLNPEKQQSAWKNWRKNNKEKHCEYNNKRRQENPEYFYGWYEENRRQHLENVKKWGNENYAKRNDYAAKRRANKRGQTPKLTKDEKTKIEQLYKKAKLLGMHVDHIIPISKGGQHCLNNLQILSVYGNLSKGNKLNAKSICSR